MNRHSRSLLIFASLALPPVLFAQPALKKDVAMIYTEICANCHGKELEGAQAPSLLDDVWAHGNGDDASIATVIRDGALEKGMPAFHSLMTEGDIRTMVIFIREQRAKYSRSRVTKKTYPTGTQTAAGERFRIETVADNLATPWSIAFLPDDRMLVTEKSGRLRVIEHGKLLPVAITGTPAVRDEGQGGLLEVAVHPQYTENGWIYLAYSDPAKDEAGRNVSLTTLVRGRIKDGAWTDQETIWRAPLELYRTGGAHFGCRIAFDDRGYLFFSHGERGRGPEAQELSRPNGKIHRIHDDGRIPVDNPFVGTPGAFPSIWTYGNRNPQGLDFDPRTGVLWETEHGPRGGDEVNVIRGGRNYGWPVITYGMNYDGSALTDKTAQEGMEQPVTYWTPSIAVCGIDFYEGSAFPAWTGNLFVTALAQQELRRLVIDGEQVVRQDVILKDLGRLRDVASGPDGAIYIAVNDPGRIIRLVPAR